MTVYTIRCIMPGDDLPSSVTLFPGDDLTVEHDGRVIYAHVAAEMCVLEFGYMEVRERVTS